MKNIYSNYNSYFCLLQQITLDKDEKYFIFGIKFDDIFIPENQDLKEKIKLFLIEKTYLFISSELLCKLFEHLFIFILSYKKLIFFKNIIDYNSLKDIGKIKKFNEANKENVSNFHFVIFIQVEVINKIFDYIYDKKFPKPNEYFSYCCPITKLPFNYNFPSKYDIPFLPMEYLGPNFYKLLNPGIIIDLIFKILSEQSLIFVSDDLQNLTSLV